MGRARIFVLLGLTACGGAETVEDTGPIRPTSTAVLTLDVTRHALPEALVGSPALFVESNGASNTVVGGDGGLFQWEIDRFVSVADVSVTAIARTMVAADGELFVLEGTLDRSPLTDALDGPIGALAWRGDELWLATATSVYRWASGELFVFDDIEQTTALAAFDGSRDVVVSRPAGAFAFRAKGNDFTMRDLATETGGIVVPSRGDRLLALHAGALLEREVTESGVRWRPVALDGAGAGATGLTALHADPTTGAAWTIDKTALHRIDGGAVARVPIGDITTIEHTSIANDGAIWLGDGTTLVRYAEIETVTYAEHIAPFAETNCLRCHTALGTARPLDTLETWVTDIDAIITQLEEQKMPADGAALVGGGVDLVKRWKEDGLLP
jgi:hypothetical protein